MRKFAVTYEITTPESAELGDYDESGFELQDVGLRDAMKAVFETRTNRVDGIESIEANCSSIPDMRWLTVYNGPEFETGAQELRSLHIPDSVTPSSRRRIFALAKGSA